MRYFLLVFCLFLSFTECPERFEIKQDRALRMFQIVSDHEFLGNVVSSDRGKLDFYNSSREIEYVNYEDSLFDADGSSVAFLELASDNAWFPRFSQNTRIDIVSQEGELLATVEAEGPENQFVFRDPITLEPIATAQWDDSRYSCARRKCFRLQDWSVTVTNREKIPYTLMVWALLKHSQKLFPAPGDECPFEVDYELDKPEAPFTELPNEFHIQQDHELRQFRLTAHDELLNIILNSKSHKFDFYDSQNQKQGCGQFHSLYQPSGQCMGYVKVKSDFQFLPPYSKLIEILSDEDELLASVQPEDDEKEFVFRDAETGDILATARWNCLVKKHRYFSWLDQTVQDWTVTILHPERLQEKEISKELLVWALLKHSEKYLPPFWFSSLYTKHHL